jgi:hypothetical protein
MEFRYTVGRIRQLDLEVGMFRVESTDTLSDYRRRMLPNKGVCRSNGQSKQTTLAHFASTWVAPYKSGGCNEVTFILLPKLFLIGNGTKCSVGDDPNVQMVFDGPQMF